MRRCRSVRLDPADSEASERLAAASGMLWSDWMRALVQMAIRQEVVVTPPAPSPPTPVAHKGRFRLRTPTGEWLRCPSGRIKSYATPERALEAWGVRNR